MLGISTSVFNEAGGLVKDWLKNPWKAGFLYWYFLPAAGFVLLQLFIIGPALGYPAPVVFRIEAGTSKSAIDLLLQVLSPKFFAIIILPLVAGVILSALASTTLRLYQGTSFLTRPFFRKRLARNQCRSSELYGPLHAKRRQYLFLATQDLRLFTIENEERAEFVPESDREALADQLKKEIQDLHEKIEEISTARELPIDPIRVGANDLANTLAAAEEYPFERYSMDAAVFWPRLSAEIDPKKLESLTTSFAAMNGLLNLSLMSWIFGIESLIVGVGTLADWKPFGEPQLQPEWLFVCAIASTVVGMGAYRAAVSAARSVGDAMRTAFDYYRSDVLRRFNLAIPEDIEQERVVWLKLGAFIRRGESFYYPSQARREMKE